MPPLAITVLRLRRLAAALMGLLSLQLSLLGAGADCARGTAATAAASVAVPGDAASGHQHHEAPAPEEDAGHRPVPAHCQATVSCAMVGLATVGSTLSSSAVMVASRAHTRDDAAPRSVRQAPEPPPPRA